jgi:hypothetical protein
MNHTKPGDTGGDTKDKAGTTRPYPICWTKLTISNGQTIESAVPEAVRVSRLLQIGVHLIYNDNTIFVHPGDTTEEILKKYYG